MIISAIVVILKKQQIKMETTRHDMPILKTDSPSAKSLSSMFDITFRRSLLWNGSDCQYYD